MAVNGLIERAGMWHLLLVYKQVRCMCCCSRNQLGVCAVCLQTAERVLVLQTKLVYVL